MLGTSEGAAVGLSDGDALGTSDGDVDGFAVGIYIHTRYEKFGLVIFGNDCKSKGIMVMGINCTHVGR